MFQKDRTFKMSVDIKVLLFLSLAAFVTEAVFIANSSNCQDSEDQSVCITSDCVTAAASVMSKMDPTADPCDDFYQFACGRWLKETVIPEDKEYVDASYSVIRDRVGKILINLLEEESEDDEKDFIRKVKTLYRSCMDLESINAKGVEPLVSLVQSTFQGWPIANGSWDESQFDFQEGVKNVLAMNLNSFFKVFKFYDLKNSSRNLLYINQPSLVVSGGKGRNVSSVKAYEDRIVATAQLMAGDTITVDRDQAREIVDFEVELAKIRVPFRDQKDLNKKYNPTNLTDLQRDYGEIVDWPSLIKDMFAMDGVNHSFADDETIINIVPRFFNNLTDLLNDTPMRVKANFMIWRFVDTLSYYLSEDFLKINQDYNKVISGVKKDLPRSDVCTEMCTRNMGLAAGSMFIKKNFKEGSKEEANEMIDNLQAVFNEMVDGADWLDDITKERVKEKNHYIHRNIGYQEKVTNDTAMSILYENFTFSADDYFSNKVGALQERFKNMLRSVHLPNNPKEWDRPPTYVNAYYDTLKNQIIFTAGVLQPPLFNLNYPRSLNYGAMGSIMGHEITHGFGYRGRLFDKDGNMVEWWNETAVNNFEERAKCMVEQYESFFYEEANMTVLWNSFENALGFGHIKTDRTSQPDTGWLALEKVAILRRTTPARRNLIGHIAPDIITGDRSLTENVADNGGIKKSFKAYRRWVAAQGNEEDKLPGLNLDHNQLIFLAFAQRMCGKERKESAISNTKSGWYTPNRFRVIGPLQNSEDFSEAYQCKPGSYMNPEKKCSVW